MCTLLLTVQNPDIVIAKNGEGKRASFLHPVHWLCKECAEKPSSASVKTPMCGTKWYRRQNLILLGKKSTHGATMQSSGADEWEWGSMGELIDSGA